MGAFATSAHAASIPALSAGAEARETGGVTTRLILDYVAREGGADAVQQLLRSRGLEEREADLRNEDHWSSYATKIALLEGAAGGARRPARGAPDRRGRHGLQRRARPEAVAARARQPAPALQEHPAHRLEVHDDPPDGGARGRRPLRANRLHRRERHRLPPGRLRAERRLPLVRADPVRPAAGAREPPRLRAARRRHLRLRAALADRRLALPHRVRSARRRRRRAGRCAPRDARTRPGGSRRCGRVRRGRA